MELLAVGALAATFLSKKDATIEKKNKIEFDQLSNDISKKHIQQLIVKNDGKALKYFQTSDSYVIEEGLYSIYKESTNNYYNNYYNDVFNEFFLKKKLDYFHFIKLAENTLSELLNIYLEKHNLKKNDVVLVFSSDNFFKIVADEFTLMLPNTLKEKIQDQFNTYFNMTYPEFTILINDNLKNKTKIKADLSYLVYGVLNLIRDHIDENNTKYFDYFRYNKMYRHMILNNIKNQLNDKYYKFMIDNINNIYFQNDMAKKDTYKYNNAVDNYVFSHDNSLKQTHIHQNKSSCISIDINDINHDVTKQKLIFNFNYSIKSPDSIVSNIEYAFFGVNVEYKQTIKSNIQNYNFILNKELILKFNGYKLDNIIEEHEKTLFIDFKNESVEIINKHINQLCYYYFIDMFRKTSSLQIKQSIISNLRNITDEILNKKYNLSKLKKQIKNILSESTNVNLKINHIFKEYNKILDNKLSIPNNKLKIYLKIIIFNVNKINNLLKDLFYYCKQNNIKTDLLYNVDVTDLI